MEIKKNKLSLPTITPIYIYVSLLYTVLYCLPKSLVLIKNCGNCKKILWGAIDKFVARSAK